MEPFLRLDHVSKYYGEICALQDISLEIGAGITGLLGPNGAGKTTLIKLLLGLVKLTEGDGQVLGYRVPNQARQIRARVGYMPEDDCYIPGLSGVELVQFMARLSGQPAIEGLRRSHEILDYCGVGQERYRDVATYSTGMRQQLKFAQAIVHDPRILILDEPTAGLDPDERQAMLGRIRYLASEAGKVVIISTHILPDVEAICDNVVIMVQGQVRLIERLDVLNRPTSPAYRVRLSGPAEPFLERINQAGFQVERDVLGRITIRGMDEGSVDSIWQWASESGVGITSLIAARNSLEDVFLAAIQGPASASP